MPLYNPIWIPDSPGAVYKKHTAIGSSADVDGTGQVNSILQDIFGVGTTTHVLALQETATGTPTTFSNGLMIKHGANYGSAFTTHIAIEALSATIVGNTTGGTILAGFFGGAVHRGTGTVTFAYGVPGIAMNTAGGTVTSAYGTYGNIQNSSTGTITNAYSCLLASNTNTGGGTVTNNYGLYLEAQSAGTTDYNLYSAGILTDNYFDGYVRTGSSGGFYMNASGSVNNRFVINTPNTADATAESIMYPSSTARKPLVLQLRASQTANAFEVQDSTGAVLALFAADGYISVPGAGANSERFGASTLAAGDISVALGSAASASQIGAIAIGESSASSGIGSVAIGQGTISSAISTFALGAGSVASGNYGVAIGGGTSTGTATNSIAIGSSASISNGLTENVAIGHGMAVSNNNVVAIGGGSMTIDGRQAVIIGYNVTDGGGDNVILGYQASAGSSGTAHVVIGHSASAGTGTGSNSKVVIGYGASGGDGSNDNVVAIGRNSAASGIDTVAIGSGATATNRSLAFGKNATASGQYSIAFGADANVAHSQSVGIGGTSTAANQLVIGNSDRSITSAYIGKGVTHASPADVHLSITGGTGTNIAAGDLYIDGGISTGTGDPGNVVIATTAATTSGTTAQTLANQVIFRSSEASPYSTVELMPTDRTLASSASAIQSFVLIDNTYTLNATNSILPVGFNFAPTAIFSSNGYGFGSGFLFWNHMKAQNDSGSTRTIGAMGGFIDQTNLQANGGTFTASYHIGFMGQPTFDRINSGTLNVTAVAEFWSNGGTIGAGATVTEYNHFVAGMSSISNSGTLTSHYGLTIDSAATGSTNRFSSRIAEPASTGSPTNRGTLWLSYNTDSTAATGGIEFGASRDTNLYRSAANTLKTDDDFVANNVVAGTYTPTRSSETNLDSNVTMTEAQYMRVGNTVTVSGRFTADPTLTATTTNFEITLPIASNLGAAEDVAGTAFCGSIAGMGAEIIGVAANDTAQVQWISSDVTSQTWSYTFTYQIV